MATLSKGLFVQIGYVMKNNDEISNSTLPKKDLWDKFQILSVCLIPLVLGIYGYIIDETLKEREIKAKYIEIATGILRDKPSEDTLALRTWAIDLVQKYSQVPLTKEAVEVLRQTALPVKSYFIDEQGNFYTDEKGNRYGGPRNNLPP
jgi:hypothetical protein